MLKVKLVILYVFFLNWIFLSWFPYVQFTWRRQQAWESFVENKKGIAPNRIQTLTFPVGYMLTWEKAGKEFEYKGKMYDVLSIRKTESTLVIKCVSDHKEDGLIDAFKKEKQKKDNQPTKQFKVKHYLEKLPCFCFSRPPAYSLHYNQLLFYNNSFLKVPSPPPKQLFT